MNDKKVIVVGATGRVGREMLSILADEGMPADLIYAAASERSAGSLIDYGKTKIEVQDLRMVDFSKYDIALFSAGGEVSRVYAPISARNKCIVIDNTSYFRMNEDIPLIVPEINFDDLPSYDSRIISNPNCSTIQMVMPLKPLHDAFGLTEVIASTYQAVSGAGQKGVDELEVQVNQFSKGEETKPSHFNRQIAFNIIPQIDVFTDSRYTKEEVKMMEETKKILKIKDLVISATCVRVPVFVGHAVSVYAKFNKSVGYHDAIDVMKNFHGIRVLDDLDMFEYTTPIDAAGKDEVFISRIRKHPTMDNVLSFWCVSDNLRKGAALNAIQIAKRL